MAISTMQAVSIIGLIDNIDDVITVLGKSGVFQPDNVTDFYGDTKDFTHLQTKNIYYINNSFVKHRIRKNSIIGKRYSKRNLNCYMTVIDELLKFQHSPIISKFARYTLSKVFYTGHLIPFSEKPGVFWRAVKSGYLKYIGLKSIMVFWLKRS